MRQRLLLIMVIGLSIFLSSCNPKLDYSDFLDNHVTTYYQAETASNNRYIIYYYDSSDSNSEDIKEEMLAFIDSYDTLPIVMVDALDNSTVSDFGAYNDQPLVYVVSDHEPIETYNGVTEIKEFISTYQSMELTYDDFDDQFVEVEDLFTIDNSDYLVFSFDPSGTDSQTLEETFLNFAFTKSVEDIYFLDITTVATIPTELSVLASGEPMILLMSYGVYAQEYYLGLDEILSYIEAVGDGDIYTSMNTLDYDDFIDYLLDSYNDTLTITDDLHLEYYYSPYCSHCNSIKTKMLAFLFQLDDMPYYLINTSATTGLIKIEDFIGTPSLYVVYNGEIVDQYIGAIQIPDFIDDYRSGSIDYSNYQ